MKLILIIVAIIIGVILYINLRSTETNSVKGKLSDIEEHLKNLMYSEVNGAFLAVSIAETSDFIQFTGDKTGVQLDLPQITNRQKEMNSKFHTIAKNMGLIVIKNEGTDGSQFLDINLHGDLEIISETVSQFITDLYDVNNETDIIYTTN